MLYLKILFLVILTLILVFFALGAVFINYEKSKFDLTRRHDKKVNEQAVM